MNAIEQRDHVIELFQAAIRAHSRWCGYRADAPGDSSLNEALRAADALYARCECRGRITTVIREEDRVCVSCGCSAPSGNIVSGDLNGDLVIDVDAGEGLAATHRWKAPGVWLPKATTRPCGHEELIGPTLHRCELAPGHEGEHRDATGNPIYPPPTYSEGDSRG